MHALGMPVQLLQVDDWSGRNAPGATRDRVMGLSEGQRHP